MGVQSSAAKSLGALFARRWVSDHFVKTIRRAADYAPSRDGCVAPDPPSFHASAENPCENIPQNPDIPRGGRAMTARWGMSGKTEVFAGAPDLKGILVSGTRERPAWRTRI